MFETSTKKAVLALWIGLLVGAGTGWAQYQGRVSGTVLNDAGEPLEGVKVTITTEEINNFEVVETTNKKGRFAVAFVDSTKEYQFTLEKEGYETLEVPVNPAAGGSSRHEFRLAEAGQGDGSVVAEELVDPAIEAYNEGVEAVRAGDVETGKEKFLLAKERNSRLGPVWEALAAVYLEEGDLEQAEAHAERAVELEEESVRARLVLYDVYNGRGETDKAQAIMNELRSMGGGEEAAIRIFNEGAKSAQRGDLETAKRLFNEALGLNPEMTSAYSALAFVELNSKRYAEAVVAADAALALDPGQINVLEIKFDALRALGDDAGAEQVLESMAASDETGTATVFFERGKKSFEGGDTAGALDYFQKALAVEPDDARVHYMLGLSYINLGDTAKAKEHLNRFLELAPDDPEAANAKQMLEYVG